jgi:hypothetical protein
MNKFHKTFLTIFSGALFFVAAPVSASIIDVQFEQNPLFGEVNFAPGSSVARWVKVTNSSGEAKKIATEAVNYPGGGKDSIPADDLSRYLRIVIREQGGSDLYTGSLYNFYRNGETYLSEISDGDNEVYEYEISFPSEEENGQGATTGFDIEVGFQGEGTTKVLSSMGGGTYLFDFKILNVTSSVRTDSGRNDATVEWDTNAEASTQIIFSRQDQAHELINNPPYYGYANVYPLPADPNFTFHHKVLLSSLTPCSTYYYRVVSHRQGVADTVSAPEQSFSTACPRQEEENNGEEQGFEPGDLAIGYRGGSNRTGGENNNGSVLGTSSVAEISGQENVQDDKNGFDPRNFMATLSNFFNFDNFGTCWPNFPWWFFLLFSFYPILQGVNYWTGKRKKSIFFLLLSLIPIIIAIWAALSQYLCLPWWLLLLLFIASIAIWMIDRRKNTGENK